jgi:hypothetical protein
MKLTGIILVTFDKTLDIERSWIIQNKFFVWGSLIILHASI